MSIPSLATRFIWSAAGSPPPVETDGSPIRARDWKIEAENTGRKLRKKASEAAATAFAYRLTAALKDWDADAPAPSPLTITHSRDGLGYFAFPLDHDEVPEEVSARIDCATWFEENQAAPFGRGATPEAALADLRERARAVKAQEGT